MQLTIREALEKGIEAHRASKFQNADRYYTAILKANPKHPDANHNMGVLAVDVGKVQEALPFFKTALEVNPTISQYWQSYIDALIKLDRMADAIAVLDQAKSNGAKGDGFDRLEKQLARIGKDIDVKFAPEKLEEPSQKQIQPLINLYTNGQYQKALNKGAQLLERFPKSIDVLNIIGAANQGLGFLEDAIEAYKKALSIKPDYAEAYYNIGLTFQAQGKLEDAIEAYNRALSIKPDYAKSLNNMGNILKEQGRLEEAIEVYNKALSHEANFAEAYNNLGGALKQEGKIYEAIEAYNKALAISPDNAEVCKNLALALYQVKKFKEAEPLFRKNKSITSQTWLLKCMYELNKKSAFFDQLDYLITQGGNNSTIGSYISRSNIRYGISRENPFCNQPLKYVLKTDLVKECDFQDVFVKGAVKILNGGIVQNMKQTLIRNGNQTAGDVFGQMGQNREKIQDIILRQLENYRLKYKDSNEGLINNWPKNFRLNGWIVKMKNGGAIKPHMHEQGWISGSVYINVPPKLKEDSGNLVVCIDSETGHDAQSISIDVVTGSLCLFPSSLLHYTIPFESTEDRIVLAFDMVPSS